MEIIEIIKIVIVILSVITATISTIISVKKGKVTTDTKSDFITILNENVIKYMQTAETVFKQLSSVGTKLGNLKETDVLNKIKLDCFSKGVDYNEELAKEKIKELIEFSKTVNSK